MPSSISHPGSRDDNLRTLALWSGLLAGPLLFLSVLEVNYVLSYVACEQQQTWFLHLSTAIALVLTAAAGVWAWRAGMTRGTFSDECVPVGPETRYTRTRWMAVAAALVTVGFLIAIFSMAVPAFVLSPCQ